MKVSPELDMSKSTQKNSQREKEMDNEEGNLDFKELNQEISMVINEQNDIMARLGTKHAHTTGALPSNSTYLLEDDNLENKKNTINRIEVTQPEFIRFPQNKKLKNTECKNSMIMTTCFSPVDTDTKRFFLQGRIPTPQPNPYSRPQLLFSQDFEPVYKKMNSIPSNQIDMQKFIQSPQIQYDNRTVSTQDSSLFANCMNSIGRINQSNMRANYYQNEWNNIARDCSVLSPNNNPNDEMLLNKMMSRSQGKHMRSNTQNAFPNQANFTYNLPQLQMDQTLQSQFMVYPQMQNTRIDRDPMECLRNPQDMLRSKREYLDEEYNRINLENILKRKDKRTSLIIRHIPNKYSLKTFLDEINVDFINTYDLLYLPIDDANSCNLGFAFINFVDPMYIINFYDTLRGKKWKKYHSDKICELAYAKFQGKKDLLVHFLNGSPRSLQSEERRPLILPTPDPLPKVVIPMVFYTVVI